MARVMSNWAAKGASCSAVVPDITALLARRNVGGPRRRRVPRHLLRDVMQAGCPSVGSPGSPGTAGRGLSGDDVLSFRHGRPSQARPPVLGCLRHERFTRVHLRRSAGRMILRRAHNGHCAPSQYDNYRESYPHRCLHRRFRRLAPSPAERKERAPVSERLASI
jgi:hypothetical protein